MGKQSIDISELPAGLVIVDLSNIARDSSLGFSAQDGALSRWDRVRTAWVARFGQPGDGFVLVADASLFRKLNASDRLRLEAMEREDKAVIVDVADDEIFDRVRAADGVATVLSSDRFRDLMKRPEARTADVRHVAMKDGKVRFEKRALIRLFSAQVTSLGDAKDMQQLGLRADSSELRYRWWCRTPGCQPDPVVFPNVRSGSATCVSCTGFLERGEPWRHPAWVKILARVEGDRDMVEVDRFVIEDGDVVTLGREQEYRPGHRLRDFLPADELGKISRKHLELVNIEGTIHMQDLGSTNGTQVIPALQGRNWAPPVPLRAGQRWALSRNTRVKLARASMVIELSGRHVDGPNE